MNSSLSISWQLLASWAHTIVILQYLASHVKGALDCVTMTQRGKGKYPRIFDAAAEVVQEQVQAIRKRHGISARELAERCAKLGMPWLTRDIIANLESGRRQNVSIDEVLVLARALGVAPIYLFTPLDDDANVLGIRGAERFRRWVQGLEPAGADESIYFTEQPESVKGRPILPPLEPGAVIAHIPSEPSQEELTALEFLIGAKRKGMEEPAEGILAAAAELLGVEQERLIPPQQAARLRSFTKQAKQGKPTQKRERSKGDG